jgi:spore coat polysaccharide biosynthesis protein SpsF
MLGYLLEGLTHCQSIDGILVATSTEPSDDAIGVFARSSGVGCYRGSLHDVAGRLLAAAAAEEADAIVRLSGDSPLLDPALVDRAVAMFRADLPDLVSNVVTRTFPKGQSVEVLSRRTLAGVISAMTRPEEREHVTPYFYARPDTFTIRSFVAAHPRPALQLSIDDASDFARCEAILEHLGQPPWQVGWEACVRASDALEAGTRS